MTTKRSTDQHSSQFLITLNSNSKDAKWAPKLTEALEAWFSDIESYLMADSPDKVDVISDPTAACEVGSIKGFWHCHLFFRVEHRTKVQINLPKSSAFFKKQLDRNVYFNVRWIRDNQISITNYLKKQSAAM
jgi:hypothetical protein